MVKARLIEPKLFRKRSGVFTAYWSPLSVHWSKPFSVVFKAL